MARQYSVKRWQLKRSNRNSRTEEGKWGAPVTTPRPFNLTNVGRGTDASTAPPDAPPEEKLIGRLSAACQKLFKYQDNLERAKGLEPSTPTLARSCSCFNALPHRIGAVYKKRAGIFSRHHDDTMVRDENPAKNCEKYLILLNKFAGVVQWQNGSFPSCERYQPRGISTLGKSPSQPEDWSITPRRSATAGNNAATKPQFQARLVASPLFQF